LFGGFFYDFFGLDFEFFQYDQSLNISEGVVLVNEYKALESWSDFLNFYTIGVSGKRYSFFVYQSFGDYQLLTDIFLLFLKFYNSSVSLCYISHEYGYNSYCEFFGADELLFDQLIKDIDYPCRKVNFFEPLQPTTEFLQIESDLNKIISDQGFYSIIQLDHFVDLSKQMRGTSRDQADWLVSMIPEMQARASLPSEDTFTQALQVRNLFVALAREMIYDKRWVNQLNGLKPLWTKEYAVIQMSSHNRQSSDGSLIMILKVFFDADGLLNDLSCHTN